MLIHVYKIKYNHMRGWGLLFEGGKALGLGLKSIQIYIYTYIYIYTFPRRAQ